MGIFDLFGGRTLEAVLEKARKCLAGGAFDDALKAVAAGLERFPDAAVLRETGHAIRRAQARAGMDALLGRIDRDAEPAAYEQLIALYKDVGMTSEMISMTERYVEEHPDREAPHLLRGEQALEAYFDDLRVRDGRLAIDHLLRAGALHPDSLKPRLLLAEIFFAIGADRALMGQAIAIERLAGEDEVLAPVVAAIREVARPTQNESVDALLSKVEVSGQVVRDPSTWSQRKRRGIGGEQDAARVSMRLERLVREEYAEEAVAIDRSGAILGCATGATLDTRDPKAEGDKESGEAAPESALAGVARAVARTVKMQTRELEMGQFRRCTVEGPFGVMVVADAAGGVVAAKGKKGTDANRLAERLSVAVEGGRGRRAS